MFPDVLLIDGGLGQLRKALEAFHALDIKPPLDAGLWLTPDKYVAVPR